MSDNLRTAKIANMSAPVGTPIIFQGNIVGSIISNGKNECTCMLNSDMVNSWIKNNKFSISLEVKHAK